MEMTKVTEKLESFLEQQHVPEVQLIDINKRRQGDRIVSIYFFISEKENIEEKRLKN